MAKKSGQKEEGEGVLVAALNKKARRDYEISDTFEAGLALLGSEVKSIRDGGMNLQESYVRVSNSELFLVDCHISPYTFAGFQAPPPTRERKLLMHRREIERLGVAVRQKGLTLVPMRAYFKNGRCKLEVGLGKGKKLWDKREDVKAKEAKRAMDRAFRERNR